MKKAIIIMNEAHSMMDEQKEILEREYRRYEILPVPKKGWTLEEQKKISEKLSKRAKKEDATIVFVSPVPFLLKDLSLRSLAPAEFDTRILFDILVFHNDCREKKELPNGKTIQVVAQTGWQLV